MASGRAVPEVFRLSGLQEGLFPHLALPPPHLTVTPARLGFGEEEKESARPPPYRASPTHSPRPGCCFLSR